MGQGLGTGVFLLGGAGPVTRSRASAKAAGSRTGFCFQCGVEIPCDSLGRNIRKYCSTDCLNAERRRRHTPKEPAPPVPVADRFWPKVAVGEVSNCWEYQGYRDYRENSLGGRRGGYGHFGINGVTVLAHRVAWELTNGLISPGQVVRHRCDNPPCCNPEHLELGDHADNTRDAIERNRIARGSRLPYTVLSESDVQEIRESYDPGPGGRGKRSNADELAERYGVSVKYIRAVANGQERT